MKRRIVNTLLSVVLLSALFLTGCGNGETAQSTKGAADSGLENSQSGEASEENAADSGAAETDGAGSDASHPKSESASVRPSRKNAVRFIERAASPLLRIRLLTVYMGMEESAS